MGIKRTEKTERQTTKVDSSSLAELRLIAAYHSKQVGSGVAQRQVMADVIRLEYLLCFPEEQTDADIERLSYLKSYAAEETAPSDARGALRA